MESINKPLHSFCEGSYFFLFNFIKTNITKIRVIGVNTAFISLKNSNILHLHFSLLEEGESPPCSLLS